MDKLLNSSINLNYAACIKDVHNFGSTVFYNICSGEHSIVPWGSIDYVMASVGLLGLGLMVSAIVIGTAAAILDR